MNKTMTWIGQMAGSGAYPDINRHFIDEMRGMGWTVYENMHNDGGPDADVLISCTYPPTPLLRRHKLNLAISTWEFHGPNSTPASWVRCFEDYDLVVAMCMHARKSFLDSGVPANKVHEGRIGLSNITWAYAGWPWKSPDIEKGIRLLAVGGSDPRHGMDLALQTLDLLPNNYWLIWKLTPGYPRPAVDHPRVKILEGDFSAYDMARLYRSCHIFFYPVRAVAPGKPLMEALAYGMPVVTTDMLATREATVTEFYPTEPLPNGVIRVPATMESFRHHIHHDCKPQWWVAKPGDYADALQSLAFRAGEPGQPLDMRYAKYREEWAWSRAAVDLNNQIANLEKLHG